MSTEEHGNMIDGMVKYGMQALDPEANIKSRKKTFDRAVKEFGNETKTSDKTKPSQTPKK